MAFERADGQDPRDDGRFALLHVIALRGRISELPAGGEDLLDDGLIGARDGHIRLTAHGYRVHRELLSREAAGIDLAGFELAGARLLTIAREMREFETRWRLSLNDERDEQIDAVRVLVDEMQSAVQRSSAYVPRFAGYMIPLSRAAAHVHSGDAAYVAARDVDSVTVIWEELHEDYPQVLGRPHESAEMLRRRPGVDT